MSNQQLASLFIRFSALSFLFYAVLEIPDFIISYQDYSTLYAEASNTTLAQQNFARMIFRIGLQLLAATFLLGRTTEMVSLLTVGKWRPTPPPAAETGASTKE